jgi:hypothetical protein
VSERSRVAAAERSERTTAMIKVISQKDQVVY